MNATGAVFTEDAKGERDAGKEAKAAKEESAKGNGKPPAERPRFMFNIADGGFTGESRCSRRSSLMCSDSSGPVFFGPVKCWYVCRVFASAPQSCTLSGRTRSGLPSLRGR